MSLHPFIYYEWLLDEPYMHASGTLNQFKLMSSRGRFAVELLCMAASDRRFGSSTESDSEHLDNGPCASESNCSQDVAPPSLAPGATRTAAITCCANNNDDVRAYCLHYFISSAAAAARHEKPIRVSINKAVFEAFAEIRKRILQPQPTSELNPVPKPPLTATDTRSESKSERKGTALTTLLRKIDIQSNSNADVVAAAAAATDSKHQKQLHQDSVALSSCQTSRIWHDDTKELDNLDATAILARNTQRLAKLKTKAQRAANNAVAAAELKAAHENNRKRASLNILFSMSAESDTTPNHRHRNRRVRRASVTVTPEQARNAAVSVSASYRHGSHLLSRRLRQRRNTFV
jgi:hypothetical protein